jgi:hypothetical protein
MGMISNLFGGANSVTAIGTAVRGVAEVFTPSATRQMELSAEAQLAALSQLGAEYANPGLGWFDRMVNGLNRLPRPFLAFGTLGLFTYAMVDPVSFGERMVGLNLVPDPLWWLLGAIVGFYFGAREAHYFRRTGPVVVTTTEPPPHDADPNPALEDWRGKV